MTEKWAESYGVIVTAVIFHKVSYMRVSTNSHAFNLERISFTLCSIFVSASAP